ncbi:hypothetical protein PIB30_074904 [Stylosanthes scabra]|uniref:Uncharacterized protein n=1 Tax=Stylosanthes scabra TaxID=79078 RepID=A0ABU6TR93_9FABA|nr:hypothetical protein [Stylosanthes scabra]
MGSILGIRCGPNMGKLMWKERRVNSTTIVNLEDLNWEDNHERYNKMIFDAVGSTNSTKNLEDEDPNPDAARFYNHLDLFDKWATLYGVGEFFASTLHTSSFKGSAVSATSPSSIAGTDEINLREQIHLLNQNLQDMGRQLQESDEHNQAVVAELKVKNVATEELRQRMTEELKLAQNLRRQMAEYYE